MQRVLVIGPGGSGKTTFARRLAGRTGLPLIHLDAEYWLTGWRPRPDDEWVARVRDIVQKDRWILDGNYGGTLDIRLERCDTIVFLDVPRVACLWRVVKRWIRHAGRQRPEMPAGCEERLTWDFVRWIWTYPTRRRGAILRRLEALGDGQRAFVLRSAGAAWAFLAAS